MIRTANITAPSVPRRPSARSPVLASFLVLNPVATVAGSTAEESPPEMDGTPSDVQDPAGLFSAEAIRSARETLEKLEKSTGVPT